MNTSKFKHVFPCGTLCRLTQRGSSGFCYPIDPTDHSRRYLTRISARATFLVITHVIDDPLFPCIDASTTMYLCIASCPDNPNEPIVCCILHTWVELI